MVISPKRIMQRKKLAVRSGLWPDLDSSKLWSAENTGFAQVPRTMPIMMNIMDDLSGKGFPVGQTYFELWCRLREEHFLQLSLQEEMAFHAGFSGQRAVRTWKERVKRLVDLGFFRSKPGPFGEISYILFLNPYYVIQDAHTKGQVSEAKWQALIVRSVEIGATDLNQTEETTSEATEKVERTAATKRNRLKILKKYRSLARNKKLS